jgi:lipopolysaccharide/colanic/teichoic acid biosynthesis glycosyltransferase
MQATWTHDAQDAIVSLPANWRLPAPSAKRAFDMTFSVLLLIALVPLFALLIAAQLASNPRAPVFFRQMRVGRGGALFPCLKFRTMCPDAATVLRELLDRDPAARAEWTATQKLKHDPRVSRVGAILRATSLDELPQLWNVLRGDMSLVGPRPVTATEIATRYEPLGGGTAYKSVRPGITGLWQVSGRSGTTYEHRVALDCKYVRELSFANDLQILVRTVGVVLRQSGAC